MVREKCEITVSPKDFEVVSDDRCPTHYGYEGLLGSDTKTVKIPYGQSITIRLVDNYLDMVVNAEMLLREDSEDISEEEIKQLKKEIDEIFGGSTFTLEQAGTYELMFVYQKEDQKPILFRHISRYSK